jgi:hypothetical protein
MMGGPIVEMYGLIEQYEGQRGRKAKYAIVSPMVYAVLLAAAKAEQYDTSEGIFIDGVLILVDDGCHDDRVYFADEAIDDLVDGRDK